MGTVNRRFRVKDSHHHDENNNALLKCLNTSTQWGGPIESGERTDIPLHAAFLSIFLSNPIRHILKWPRRNEKHNVQATQKRNAQRKRPQSSSHLQRPLGLIHL